MTPNQRKYLTGWNPSDDEVEDYFDTGVSCYEDGYIDDFGMVTPKAWKDLESE